MLKWQKKITAISTIPIMILRTTKSETIALRPVGRKQPERIGLIGIAVIVAKVLLLSFL